MFGAFPADCPLVRLDFNCRVKYATSTNRLCEEFPAYGSVLLRLRYQP